MPDEKPVEAVSGVPKKQRRKKILLSQADLSNLDKPEPSTTDKTVAGQLPTDAIDPSIINPNITTSHSIDRVDRVVKAIQDQKPLKAMQDELSTVLADLASKADIVRGVMLSHQLERLVLYSNVRWKIEKDLLQKMMAKKLTAPEEMALLRTAIDESDKIQEYIDKFSSPLGNVAEALEKADRALSGNDKRVKKELEGTRTHGRDIMSKLTHKAKKVAATLAAQKSNGK